MKNIINDLIESSIEKVDISIKYNKRSVLVLSGGSFKGLAYVGVIQALNKLNILKNINTFVGTSIGSIFAFLLSLNSYVEEIEELIENINFDKLFSYNVKKLYCNYGLNDGMNLIEILENFLIKKNFNKNITFKELKDLTNNTLIINSSNITKRKNVIFDFETYPDLEILKAIRMSISVPFIFTPVEFEDSYFVDGGIINSFLYNYLIKERNIEEFKIIGVLLNDKIENQKKSFTNYIMDIYYSLYVHMYEELDLNKLIVINIQNCNISTFKIKKKEVEKIINEGYNKTIEFFKN